MNYTYTDSNAVTNPEYITLSSYDDRPLVGQPDDIFNLQFGFYGADDSRFSIVYNDVGNRIRELGVDTIPNVMEDLTCMSRAQPTRNRHAKFRPLTESCR